jgi:uncharacterized zinc-type alcohol dehydrogenase-like protein
VRRTAPRPLTGWPCSRPGRLRRSSRALRRTPWTARHGLKLGADHYYVTSDADAFKQLANTFDLIVNTVSAPLDLDAYLRLLRLDGTLVNVGAPPEALPVHVFTLFGNRRSFAGSGIGSIRETQQMLYFCAEHGIARRPS